jgi:flagellum-specific ATP synthase
MPNIVSDEHLEASRLMRELLAVYSEAEDLINIGAYKQGSNPKIDKSIEKNDECVGYLRQGVHEQFEYDDIISRLIQVANE